MLLDEDQLFGNRTKMERHYGGRNAKITHEISKFTNLQNSFAVHDDLIFWRPHVFQTLNKYLEAKNDTYGRQKG